jgi:hypothetical protein
MSVTPAAPPVLGLTAQADATDSQLIYFTVTGAQGTDVTLSYGDGQADTYPVADPLLTEHRYGAAGTYAVTAHSTAAGQADATISVTVAASAITPPSNIGRPSVEEVAVLIRARTKDSQGNEVGTFDDDTRPTSDEVEEQIDAAYSLVGCRFPDPGGDNFPERMVPAFQALVAYRAAMRVEKSYFPEQVRTDRSAYTQLREEYLDDLEAFTTSMEAGGGEELLTSDVVSLPVGSWTSIPYTWIRPSVPPDPELEPWAA